MTDHPDFLAADAGVRWTKPLAELGAFLREKAWKAQGAWVYRILPGGACVAMRVIDGGDDAFKRELRVSRREPLASHEAMKKWATECRVFRHHLGCENGWTTQLLGGRAIGDPFQLGDKTEWLTREDRALGRPVTDKPALICVKCGRVAEPGSEKYKEILCNKCALELSTKEQQPQFDLQLEKPLGAEETAALAKARADAASCSPSTETT